MPTSPSKKQTTTARSGQKTRLHLRKGRRPGQELKAVAALQLKAALDELKGNNVSPDPIHHARTYIKKVRSIIQIASPALPRALRGKLQGQLKQAACRMAPLRDSEVRLQTLDLLLKRFREPFGQFSAIRNGFADVARQQRVNGAKQIPRVIGFLRKTLASVPDWPMDELRPRDLHRRIKGTYRRGRTLLDLCRSTKDPEDFHRWRKQVKQLWYQLRITAPHWPGDARELIEASGEIGHYAGIERDYTLLAAELAKGPRSKASLILQETIARLLPDLRRKAISAGELLYARKPKAFVEDLRL